MTASARTARARVAVLASGGGSNLQALLDHAARAGDGGAYDVALVAANVAGAGALDRARRHGVAAAVLDAPADAERVLALLDAHSIDLVVLAGYLKLVPAAVARRYHGRMLNVHPALLPAFGGPGMYGARVHRAVIDAGVRVSGATVHFVDEHYDRGAIVAQWPVPVFDDDTPQSLAARVLGVEHALLPRVVDAVAAGRVSLDAHARTVGAFATPGGDAAAAARSAFAISDDDAAHARLLTQLRALLGG